MALRRLVLTAGLAGAGLAAVYRDDLVQLQFDIASASGPLLRLLDAETAHNVGIAAARAGLFPRESRPDPEVLRLSVWGRQFSNPIGLAAGFDKNAEAMRAMLGLGFGFVEIGSVTPLPQPGNPQPRVFRLPEAGAVINRYGFNSDGVDAVAARLDAFRQRHPLAAAQASRGTGGGAAAAADSSSAVGAPGGVLGVNLGKNKTSEDAAGDYCVGVARLARYADYLVINVSSPNTPGLRALQDRRSLERLVRRVKLTRDGLTWGPAGPPPLLVKVAPDLTPQDIADIAVVALKAGVDGLIVSNTTIERPESIRGNPAWEEAGGLSGAPLFEPSTAVLRDLYRLTKGTLPIIGCGGVASGEQAYAKIRAGASLVQLYTGLVYGGPAAVPRIKRELAACLQRDGFASVAEAVGADHRAAK